MIKSSKFNPPAGGQSSKLIVDEILNTVKYFSFFDYPPTLEEIHTFLKKKTSKRALAGILEKMEKESHITTISKSQIPISNKIPNFKFQYNITKINYLWLDSLIRYTLHQYHKKAKNLKLKAQKLKSVRTSEVSSYAKASKDKEEKDGLDHRSFSEGGKTSEVNRVGENKYSAIQQFSNFSKRQQISINKFNSSRFRLYIKFLSLFPQIKLIGLSGSVAMLNADEDHDVDLFIITSKDRLFTGRFISLLIAQLLGIRRSRHPELGSGSVFPNYYLLATKYFSNKVCLNLFFDQSDLAVPKFKRSEYVAHEVLQMKPLIDKNNTYLRFIDANRWIFDIFPNTRLNIKYQISNIHIKNQKYFHIPFFHYLFDILFLIFNIVQAIMEKILKKVQMHFINKHRTSELVSSTQLWFHPDDFEKKIKFP